MSKKKKKKTDFWQKAPSLMTLLVHQKGPFLIGKCFPEPLDKEASDGAPSLGQAPFLYLEELYDTW